MPEGVLLLQVALGIVLATVLNSVLAVSFGLFYRMEKFFNFAHAGVFAFVAYIGAAALRNGALPIYALVLCCASAIGIEILASAIIRRGSRDRTASGLLGLMLSYAVYLVTQGFLTIVEVELPGLFKMLSQPHVVDVFGVFIATHQIMQFCIGCAMLIAVACFFARTLAGWRAVAAMDDFLLCETLGNDASIALRISRVIACCFLGAGAYFASSASVLHPEMGFIALQTGIIVWIMGGRSMLSMLLSAFSLSLLQNLAGWVAPTNFSSAIVCGSLAILAVAKGPLIYWCARLRNYA